MVVAKGIFYRAEPLCAINLSHSPFKNRPQTICRWSPCNVDGDLKKAVESVARGHASPRAFYVDKVAEGVATIAVAFWPKPVIVRLSDFKSKEYRKLIGAEFGEAFAMECEALKRLRNDMGLTNVEIVVPFVRTLGQAKAVGALLDKCGLSHGQWVILDADPATFYGSM